MSYGLEAIVARWTEDRSNGDPINLIRSIRVEYSPAAKRDHRFAAIGMRQGWKGEWAWVVIASVKSGPTVAKAIRKMIAAYWKERERERER